MIIDRKIVLFSLAFFLAGLTGTVVLGLQGLLIPVAVVGLVFSQMVGLSGFVYVLAVSAINNVALNLEASKPKSKNRVSKFDEL